MERRAVDGACLAEDEGLADGVGVVGGGDVVGGESEVARDVETDVRPLATPRAWPCAFERGCGGGESEERDGGESGEHGEAVC